MTSIFAEIKISRTPYEIFEYASDFSRFGEWQPGIVNGHLIGNGPPGVGSRCVITRRISGSTQTTTSEITQIDPPKILAIQGINGPVRADVIIRIDPLSSGLGSCVTIKADFFGHGVGKMILPVVIRQARKEIRESCENLKKRLEDRN